jgi:hypothetical protein
MRKTRAYYAISPYKLRDGRLLSACDHTSDCTASTTPITRAPLNLSQVKASSLSIVVETESKSPSGSNKKSVQDTFAERYEGEIAAPAKMKEYEAFAQKHRAALLAESKQLSHKYSEDLMDAYKMEETVTGVFTMLNEFVAVLQTQEELVRDVHGTSKAATAHVDDTDKELVLTLERSQSYQYSTVGLIIVLALFLLLLDSLTP